MNVPVALAALIMAVVVVPLISVVLAAVPAELAGGASGVFNTAQQLGGAVGVAAAGRSRIGQADTRQLDVVTRCRYI